MSIPSPRRTRKRLALRQHISDVATRLFIEHGFDAVTVNEIAAAADVGRMTVFNHFPRKEDMFFDRDEPFRAILREALRKPVPGMSGVAVLHRLAHQLLEDENPWLRFSHLSLEFIDAVAGSATLMSRARAIRDELATDLATALASSASRPAGDPEAALAAHLTVATWSVAFIEAHVALRKGGTIAEAKAAFLAIIDRGTAGTASAMAGTPYANDAPTDTCPTA